MLFLANFDPPSLCHTLSHISEPPKVRHTSRPHPRFLVGLVQKTRTKAPCTNSLSIVHGAFCPGCVSGGLLPGRFCLGWFLSVPPSVRKYLLQQKVKHHIRMIQKFISVTSMLLTLCSLSQTVTPSRTPSPLERDVLHERPLYYDNRNILQQRSLSKRKHIQTRQQISSFQRLLSNSFNRQQQLLSITSNPVGGKRTRDFMSRKWGSLSRSSLSKTPKCGLGLDLC